MSEIISRGYTLPEKYKTYQQYMDAYGLSENSMLYVDFNIEIIVNSVK